LPALVQFDDELPLIRFCISGNIPDAVLKVKVVNLYGEEKSLPNVAIGDGFIHYGMLRYNVFPDKPYGAFRIEAHVKKPNGERISPYYEIIVHRLHRPHYWMKDAPNSPFGIHTNSTVRHIMMAKAVGVNWTRLHDAGGTYLFDGKDRSVAVLSAKYNHAEFKIPQGDDIHASDLFGNPIALGTILGDTIVYLWANKGIEAIESILQN